MAAPQFVGTFTPGFGVFLLVVFALQVVSVSVCLVASSPRYLYNPAPPRASRSQCVDHTPKWMRQREEGGSVGENFVCMSVRMREREKQGGEGEGREMERQSYTRYAQNYADERRSWNRKEDIIVSLRKNNGALSGMVTVPAECAKRNPISILRTMIWLACVLECTYFQI